MNRKEQIIYGTLGLLFAACACLAAWLAVPQLVQFFSSPTRASPSPSNTPLVITFSPSENSPMPTIAISPTPTYLQALSGTYRLQSWNETVSVITLGVDAPEGILTIEANGAADWLLHIERRGTNPQPIPQIMCGGQVRLSSQQIEGVPGADRNGTIDVGDDFGESDMLFLTFCGWSYQYGADPFSLYLAADGNGNTILEMKNSKGTFTWQK